MLLFFCAQFVTIPARLSFGVTRIESIMSSRPNPTTLSHQCEGDLCQSKLEDPRWLCVGCDSTYCDSCWDKQGPHKTGKSGVNHEKVNRQIYDRLRPILDPPEDLEEVRRLHVKDADTTWFGVEKDGGTPFFQDYGRYAVLMAETKQPYQDDRTPQLVSFVGQTGVSHAKMNQGLLTSS